MGETEFLIDEQVEKVRFQEENERVLQLEELGVGMPWQVDEWEVTGGRDDGYLARGNG